MWIRQSAIFKHAVQSIFNKGRYQITRRMVSQSQRLVSPVLQGTQATGGLLFFTRLLRVTPPVDNQYRSHSKGSQSNITGQVNPCPEDQPPSEPGENLVSRSSSLGAKESQNTPLDPPGSQTDKDLSDVQSNHCQKVTPQKNISLDASDKKDSGLNFSKMEDGYNTSSLTNGQKESENDSHILNKGDTKEVGDTVMEKTIQGHTVAEGEQGHDTQAQNKNVTSNAPSDTSQDISEGKNMTAENSQRGSPIIINSEVTGSTEKGCAKDNCEYGNGCEAIIKENNSAERSVACKNNFSHNDSMPTEDIQGFQCPFSGQGINSLDTETSAQKDGGSWQGSTDISSRKNSVAKLSCNTHSNGVPDLCATAVEHDERHLLPTNQNDLNTFYDPLKSSMCSETEDDHEEDCVNEGGDIVLVTGGNGFFGQHIIKMLQVRAPHVSEIWVLDLEPFVKKLDYRATKPVKSFVGSITDAKLVDQVLQGAHSVMHVAGLVSWGTFPDFKGMEQVNVMGTLNVFNACIKNNIQRLIYCSSVDVVVGYEPIRGGTEENTHVPDKFLFPGYPDTKYHGERIVLGSLRQNSCENAKLQTVILRANVNYGELDATYLTNTLRAAKRSKGVVYQIGDGTAMFQQAYVGNTAWAFVCADKAMKENPNLTGEIFYIPDNTPVQNSFNFTRPYLEARGFRLGGKLPYSLVYGAVSAAETLAKGLSPFYKINLPFQSCVITYINTDLYFCGNKAREILKYEPIYSPNEARVNSLKYYNNIDLDEKTEQKEPFRSL